MSNFRFFLTFLLALSLFFVAPSRAGEIFFDQLDREVRIEKIPDRIISLAPNVTEILFALGAGGRVVGVTEFSNYPEEARSLPVVGTYIKPNLERIVELSPDLVIATADGDKEDDIKKLDSLGIPVYVINPMDVDAVIETIREVGILIGSGEEARLLTRAMEEEIAEITGRVSPYPGVRVLLELGINPVITISSGTFQDDLIRLAGGINIAAGEPVRYPRFSIEEIIVRAPEVIVITSMSPSMNYDGARARWETWENIPAVGAGRVYVIDSDIVDRPSPRIVDGLRVLAEYLHPEAFSDGGNNGD
jgi:iron complex transport system substrate-binding protein